MLFRVALALLKRAQPRLMELRFEGILAELKRAEAEDGDWLVDAALQMQVPNRELDDLVHKYNDTMIGAVYWLPPDLLNSVIEDPDLNDNADAMKTIAMRVCDVTKILQLQQPQQQRARPIC